MTDEKRIRLFSTGAHPCSYFPERSAKTIFIDPDMEITPPMMSALAQRGFRRSGDHLYRPECETCDACIASRLAVDDFSPKRKQRRCVQKNQDIVIRINDKLGDEAYALYENYLSVKHRDGDMYPPSREQFESFLCVENSSPEYLCFYLAEKLIAVAVTDVMLDGLSAIYTFYDPDLDKRSLGVFAILSQIQRCKDLNLPYLYLGYWIKDCAKMAYKTEYRPIELLVKGRWLTVE
ncbi:MAG: arginyltransferase [Spongiibacteraceae bacterium]